MMLVQRARSLYWKKWAEKHELEELKEGAWIEPALAFMWPGRSSWKEVGRKRDCSTLAGRM